MVENVLFPDLAVVFINQPLKPVEDQGFVEVGSMVDIEYTAMDDESARHQIRYWLNLPLQIALEFPRFFRFYEEGPARSRHRD